MSICRGFRARRRPAATTTRLARRGAAAALGLAGVLALTGCAWGPRHAAGPPGPAEVVFNHTDAAAVSGMIASQCRTMGWSVDKAEAASVICTASETAPQRILGALTMRNAKRQTRMVSNHFLLSVVGTNVRVASESWLSDPDRGRRRELKPSQSVKIGKQMTGFLVLMGGHLSRSADAPGAEP